MLDFFIKKMYNKYNKRTKELLKIKNKKFKKTIDKFNKKCYNKYNKRDKNIKKFFKKVFKNS